MDEALSALKKHGAAFGGSGALIYFGMAVDKHSRFVSKIETYATLATIMIWIGGVVLIIATLRALYLYFSSKKS